ncbi:MAG: DUF6938 domain-containing protein [Candidatus Nealsonbacteria bacterium]
MDDFNKQKVWVVSVDMGYGHQRTAYPLEHLAFENKIINANSYQDIPKKDRNIWQSTRKFYEAISRFKRVPLIGEFAFSVFDSFQRILDFYPKRDLSEPNFSLRRIYSLFKGGWGRHLIEKLKEKPRPIISTFFTPAFMAEFFDYPSDIYCVVCDADIARPWASLNPKKSRIKYFAPNERVVERLKLYGVKKENIFLTGYPLPLESIGSQELEILKHDLACRLLNLDPKKRYFHQYQVLINQYIGELPEISDHILTVMFAVGGAGAQREIAYSILKSLKNKIQRKQIKLILVAGTRESVKDYFLNCIESLGLKTGVEIIFNNDTYSYFNDFNLALRKSDVLWTKPSELSFYTGLGLPIIVAPSIGSQEHYNREWLLKLGSGIVQQDPDHANEWLFDLLESGWFAEAAMEGFIEAEKRGVFNIKEIISKPPEFRI